MLKKLLPIILLFFFINIFFSCSFIHYFDNKNTDDTNPTITSFDSATMIAVSLSGDDTTGNGTASAPYKSLQKAVSVAQTDSTKKEIRVQSGTYTPGSGLNATTPGVLFNINYNGLKVSGGFDSDFSSISGTTVLNANSHSPPYRIVDMITCSNLTFENFTVTGANASGASGGGFCISNANGIIINATVIGNSADNGSGIYIGGASTNITINGSIQNNTTVADYGGGIFIDNASLIIISATISGNIAYSDGGGIYVNNSSSIVIQDSSIISNQT